MGKSRSLATLFMPRPTIKSKLTVWYYSLPVKTKTTIGVNQDRYEKEMGETPFKVTRQFTLRAQRDTCSRTSEDT